MEREAMKSVHEPLAALLLILGIILILGCGSGVDSSASLTDGESPSYAVPASLDDGWTPASPEDVGLDREPLEAMTAAIRRGDYRNVHAVLIAKDGRLVYEEYVTGPDRRPETGDYAETVTWTFDRETPHTTRSAAKSFTSALVGIAIEEGTIPSVESPVLELFPEYVSGTDPDARGITLDHLLTMTPGLQWDQMSLPYSDPDNSETAMYASEDPAAFVLSRSLAEQPGSQWTYSSGTTILLGLVLHRATGIRFADYIETRLFDPLGIERFDWTGSAAWSAHPAFAWEGSEPWEMTRAADPAGSLWLRPRDMLKLGQLFADGGSWMGTQVVPAEWVRASLEPRVARGVEPIEYPNGTVQHRWFGYQWWHERYELPWGETTVHYASGNGGQKIWLVPALGLTVVHLTGNFSQSGSSREADRLLLERIVPWGLGVEADYRLHLNLEPVEVDPAEWPLTGLSPEEQARYVGTYQSGDQQVEIRAIDDRIRVVPPLGDGPVDLIPTGPRSFVSGAVHRDSVAHLYFPDERLVFVVDDTGATTGFDFVDGQEVVDSWERTPNP